MKQLPLRCYVWLARIGWAVPAVFGLLLCALVVLGWWLPAERAALAQVRVDLSKAKAELAQPPQRFVTPQAIVARNLSTFYGSLGHYPAVEAPVGALFRAASESGLALKQGEYHTSYERAGLYYTYRITVPVRGTYSNIRQFCERALIAIPYAALDEVQFKRSAIGDTSIEAKLQFTLYLTDQRPTQRPATLPTSNVTGTT